MVNKLRNQNITAEMRGNSTSFGTNINSTG